MEARVADGLLAGKSAIVTGAGSGVGRATAMLFALEGCHVIAAGVRQSWARGTRDLIEAAGGAATAVTCDVSDGQDVDRLFHRSAAAAGGIDIVFNNAGISSPRIGMALEDHTLEDFDRLVAVNL